MSEITGQKVIIDFLDRPRQVHEVPLESKFGSAVNSGDGFLRLDVTDEQVLLFPIHTIREVKIVAIPEME